jgi:hypothetical protein
MEMMDIRAAIRWLNESSDLMTVIIKSAESQPKGKSDPLKPELIALQRAAIEAAFNSSMAMAARIDEQIILELPLLTGHTEDFLALVEAQTRYREESNKAYSVLMKTAPVNQTAPAAPHTLEPRTPAERMNELMAKSSPIAASTAVTTSTAEDSTSSMPSEAPVDAVHIIVEGNDNQTSERAD